MKKQPIGVMKSYKHLYYFADFSEWRNVFELIVTCNLLALTLTVVETGGVRQIDWIILLKDMVFTNSVAILFAYSLDALKHHLANLRPLQVFTITFVLWAVIIILYGLIAYLIFNLIEYGYFNINLSSLLIYLENICVVGGLLGLIVLRYLYMREQWLNRQQAEMQARLQALQARIQPHFLFNSLNSVVSLIAIDPYKAEQMLIDLSQLFRASLQEFRLISLAEEIKLCQHYLAIEKQRVGENRLTIEWMLPDDHILNTVSIPMLILQPLLENSIYHGVETLSTHSTITIEIEVVAHKVNIMIRNPCQPAETLRESHGMALKNVKQRLRTYYGKKGSDFIVKQSQAMFTVFLSYEY